MERAFAGFGSDDVFPVLFAVVVGELFARVDFALAVNENALAVDFGIAVGAAGMVYIPGSVFAGGAVDYKILVNFKQVFASLFIGFVARKKLSKVFNNKDSSRHFFCGKKAQASRTPAYAIGVP